MRITNHTKRGRLSQTGQVIDCNGETQQWVHERYIHRKKKNVVVCRVHSPACCQDNTVPGQTEIRLS